MNSEKNKDEAGRISVLNDDSAAYESLDRKRRMDAILKSDNEKFKLFTKLMRIGKMLKNAKTSP
jgi:hypothetical protein